MAFCHRTVGGQKSECRKVPGEVHQHLFQAAETGAEDSGAPYRRYSASVWLESAESDLELRRECQAASSRVHLGHSARAPILKASPIKSTPGCVDFQTRGEEEVDVERVAISYG